jgi:hypothetical protein
MPRVKKFLARIQTDVPEYVQELLSTNFKPKQVAEEGKLLGAKFRIKVDIKPYEGKPSNNVRDVFPPSEAA